MRAGLRSLGLCKGKVSLSAQPPPSEVLAGPASVETMKGNTYNTDHTDPYVLPQLCLLLWARGSDPELAEPGSIPPPRCIPGCRSSRQPVSCVTMELF